MTLRKFAVGAALAALLCAPASADYTFTQGAGQTAFSFTSTTGGTALCAAASTHCFAHVSINSAGAPVGTSAVPIIVGGSGTAGSGSTNVLTVQGITNMTPFTVNPHTIVSWGLQAQGSAVPTNTNMTGISVAGNARTWTGGALGSTFAGHVAIVDGSGAQITSFGAAANASVGATGAAVPASATYIAYGSPTNLTGVSSTNALPVTIASSVDSLSGLIVTAMTGTSTTALNGMGAQGGVLRVYVTACTVSNMHASVPTEVILQDGSGGPTLWTVPAAIAGGGAHVTFPNPIRTSANTGLFAANITSGATTKVSCTGYKAA
jgi:hypothetical protein